MSEPKLDSLLFDQDFQVGAGYLTLAAARWILDGKHHAGSEAAYRAARIIAPKLSSSDLSVQIPDLQNFQDVGPFSPLAGIYISALLDKSPDRSFRIDMSWSDNPVHNLCRNNTKYVAIRGDIGDNLGASMSDGQIYVRDSYGDNVGEGFTGGQILLPDRRHYRTIGLVGLGRLTSH